MSKSGGAFKRAVIPIVVYYGVIFGVVIVGIIVGASPVFMGVAVFVLLVAAAVAMVLRGIRSTDKS